MNLHQVAGRHGTYKTQFFRSAASRYPTRAAMLAASARKAVNRRLVLPMDAHNWERALEVLQSGYARRGGRTAEHYQAVLRNMVASTKRSSTSPPPPSLPSSASSSSSPSITHAIDHLRGQAYAGEIPTTRSLWVSLVWAYCELHAPAEAMECLEQSMKRYNFSASTLAHMATMLMPVLAEAGLLTEAQEIHRRFLSSSSSSSSSSTVVDGDEVSSASRAVMMGSSAGYQRNLAEAAARSGGWAMALAYLNAAATTPKQHANMPTRSLHELFHEVDTSQHEEAASSVMNLPSSSLRFAGLSDAAMRSMLHALCRDGKCDLAEECWIDLYGDWRDASSPLMKQPPTTDLHAMMNMLASTEDRWKDAVGIFTRFFLNCSAEEYCTSTHTTEASTVAPSSTQRPLDPTSLDLAFASFPRRMAEIQATTSTHGTLQMEVLMHPEGPIHLLDDLLRVREDVQLTNLVVETVGTALAQGSEWERLLHLVHQAPVLRDFAHAIQRKAKVADARSPMESVLRSRLTQLVYVAYACAPVAQQAYALYYYSHVFPPEVFRRLPPRTSLAALESYLASHAPQGEVKHVVHHLLPPVAPREEERLSDEERLARQPARVPTSVRRNRQSYFPQSTQSYAARTEEMDGRMKHNFAALHARRDVAFRGQDAHADPRPIPKGIHDAASGWEFARRGGEMIFSNSKFSAHPFSMHPKVMRAKADPYRGWSPWKNSSLAHRENVIKWNGHSAV